MDFFKKQDVVIGKEVLGNKCDFFKNVASTGRNRHFYRTTHNVRSQYVTVGDQIRWATSIRTRVRTRATRIAIERV